VRVNGKAVAAYPGLLEVDWRRGVLTVDLARAGIAFQDGGQCALELSYVNPDGSAGQFKAAYTCALERDVTPPTRPELVSFPPPNGFEEGFGTWKGDSAARLVRDADTAASGRWSLMVQNPTLGGSFTATALSEPFSAGDIPIIEFDYKITDAVRVDFALANALGLCTVGFTDRASQGHYLGAIEAIRPDDRWHHAEFNLLRWLRKLPYRRHMYRQSRLFLADFGHRACAPGAYYHVDNFRPVPLVSPSLHEAVRWQAWDASGIRGYSYLWSGSSEDEPDLTVDTTAPKAPLGEAPSPNAYLHVRACDMAGNWGPTAHYRFLVDREPPRVAQPHPAPGERSASSSVAFTVAEEVSAVDPQSLKVRINGHTYGPDSPGVSYEPGSGRLTWDWVTGGPAEESSVPDGSAVKVRVEARDFAGNAAEPYEWEWIMDYSRDHVPPTTPLLAYRTMPVLRRDEFEAENVPWRNARNDVWGAALQRIVRDRRTGQHCLQVRPQRGRSYMSALAFQGSYDLAKYPIVSFDYLMPPGLLVNLQVQVNGTWLELQMTSPSTQHKSLGKLDGLKLDYHWHHCWVDLLERVRKALPGQDTFTVARIVFTDPSRRNRSDARWLVDNFMICGYGGPQAGFTWRSRDITGIAGYAVRFDADPAAQPAEQVTTTENAGTFTAPGPGTYYLSVRALDNGGNWSPVATLPYFVVVPPAPAPEQPPGQ